MRTLKHGVLKKLVHNIADEWPRQELNIQPGSRNQSLMQHVWKTAFSSRNGYTAKMIPADGVQWKKIFLASHFEIVLQNSCK